MILVFNEHIKKLKIPPRTCMEWVRESFLRKNDVQLPAKISLHPQGSDFFNTMPCLLPYPENQFCVKVVHRIRTETPVMGSELWLYDATHGDLLAMMDAEWITTMRTGAVAALSMLTFRKSEAQTYGFVGLGNTARASLWCLLESEPEQMHEVLLMEYKNQAASFMERFREYKNVRFTVLQDMRDWVSHSDVMVSCITNAEKNLCDDDSAFRPGCLLIPVHTKGFQNCDLFFDKVFGDDKAHICDFKYFEKFRKFAEFTEVLQGKVEGRANDEERILCYNIGIGLHDAVFASHIYKMVKGETEEVQIPKMVEKYWI